mmetsp:Transcript_37214/g.92564  ORF Transcript_37214/g.92564 Transcript_37214/m.92564 type:complete len:122 (-) Transcript_37214:331-696(-)
MRELTIKHIWIIRMSACLLKQVNYITKLFCRSIVTSELTIELIWIVCMSACFLKQVNHITKPFCRCLFEFVRNRKGALLQIFVKFSGYERAYALVMAAFNSQIVWTVTLCIEQLKVSIVIH